MKRRRLGSRQTVYLIAGGIAVVLLGVFALAPAFLDALEVKFYDLHFALRGSRDPGDAVVIVAIDEPSLAAVGRWPWPRVRLAEIVRRLSEAGARVIALDIILSEPEVTGELRAGTRLGERYAALGLAAAGPAGSAFERELAELRRGADHDAQLEAAIRESGRVILPLVFETQTGPAGRAGPPEPVGQPLRSALSRFRHYDERGLYPAPGARGVIPPLERFAAAARGLGHVTMVADPDGSTRWEALVFEYQGYYYPAIAVEAVRLAQGLETAKLTLDFGRAFEVGATSISVDARNRMLIDYAGPGHAFRHISAVDLLAGRIPAEALRDRIVFVGATAAGTYDLRVTPTSPVYPAVEKHATVVENLLRARFLQRPAWMELIQAAGIVVGPLAFAWFLPRLRPLVGFGAALACWGLYFGAVHLAFRFGVWVSLVYASLAMFAAWVAVTGYLYVTAERRRHWIKRAFRHYVSPQLVDQLAEHPEALHFGGDIRPLTVLFSDLRGFTDFTERYAPQVVIQMLREYLTAMVDQIQKNNGTINQFLGDAILAIFGAPVAAKNHAEQACRAARDMVAAMGELQTKWRAEGKEPFTGMGVGINSGEFLVGNLGSEQLFNYTALGHGVNLGARLEALTKEFRVPIIISGATYQQVKHLFPARSLGDVKVKGKTEPIRIYELDREENRPALRVAMGTTLTITEGDVPVSAVLENLSRTGLGVRELPRAIPEGSVVQFQLELPGVAQAVAGEGRVVWAANGQAGVGFLDLAAGTRDAIQTYLQRRGAESLTEAVAQIDPTASAVAVAEP